MKDKQYLVSEEEKQNLYWIMNCAKEPREELCKWLKDFESKKPVDLVIPKQRSLKECKELNDKLMEEIGDLYYKLGLADDEITNLEASLEVSEFGDEIVKLKSQIIKLKSKQKLWNEKEIREILENNILAYQFGVDSINNMFNEEFEKEMESGKPVIVPKEYTDKEKKNRKDFVEITVSQLSALQPSGEVEDNPYLLTGEELKRTEEDRKRK